MSTPRLVVALTTFNGERHLEKQLTSIGDQRVCPDDVLISDDCSDDGTWELLHTWAAEQVFPVHLHRNPRNLGVVANMETLLRRAANAGEVVVLCDQDDTWGREKLAVVKRAFRRRSTALWLSDGYLMDDEGQTYAYPSHSLWSGVHLTPRDLVDPHGELHADGLRRLTLGMTATGAAMAVRSDAVRDALPFPTAMHEPDPPFLHDGWLAVMAALCGDVVLEPRPMISYRQHQNQFTRMSLLTGAAGATGSARLPDRRSAVSFELERLELILSSVAKHPSSFHHKRVEQLERLARFLDTRSKPTIPTVLRHLAFADYSRFANGARTSAIDLIRAAARSRE